MVNAPKVVRALGIAWIVVAAIVILIGYIGVAMTSGFSALLEMLSPFNIVNYLAVVLTLLPGILALSWANKKLGR